MNRLLSCLCLLALTGCSVFGGDSKKDPTEEPAQLVNLPGNAVKARVLWRAGSGQVSKKDFYGLRLAHNGQFLFAADNAGRVTAFDPSTGRSAWQSQTQPRLAAGVGLAGERVVVGTFDGEVIALDSVAGTVLWRTGVSSEVLAPPNGGADTIVARTGDGRLYGLASADGQRRWAYDSAAPTLSLRGNSQPVIADGRVYVGMDNGKLICLSLESGQLLWEETISAPTGRSEIDRLVDMDAEPVLFDEVLYAISYGGQLAALDASTGRSKWRHSLGSNSGLVVDEGRVYVSDRDGRVTALDRLSGAVLWQQEGLRHRQLTRPVVHAGMVAVGDFEGYVHWLSLEDGSLRGRVSAGRSALVSAPIVSDGVLYVLGRAGDIAAVALSGSD